MSFVEELWQWNVSAGQMPSTQEENVYKWLEIPRKVDDKNLETKVLLIFQKIGCTIDPTTIDDCHRLGKNNDRVVVNFTRRKDCKQILKIKKDLKNLDMKDLHLPRGTKIIYKPKFMSLLPNFVVES